VAISTSSYLGLKREETENKEEKRGGWEREREKGGGEGQKGDSASKEITGRARKEIETREETKKNVKGKQCKDKGCEESAKLYYVPDGVEHGWTVAPSNISTKTNRNASILDLFCLRQYDGRQAYKERSHD
jgi:hypothetical protein